MKKIASITFGCKVNQYETACIVDEFLQTGFQSCTFDQPADVYIINTCTVTNRTDQKSRTAIRKVLQQKRENPKIKIVVTGCYSQRKKQEIEMLGDIDLIIDNNSKSKIFSIIHENSSKREHQNFDGSFDIFDEISTTKMLDKTRAFIKIQDGCDYFCAYCAIPFARGHSRSREMQNVLKQIVKLVENGYQEFVLGGINLGLYGKDKESSLAELLFEIEKIEGVKLIRLSSIEPQLFTPELLNFFKNSKKISPHFHIPLQVGSDELLTKMGRKYSTEEFYKVIIKIKAIFPNAAIGIDVITGLPGESEDLFEKTYQFLNKLEFTYLHVFSYSKRSGTRAEKMPDQVNGKTIKERSNKLIELSDKKLKKYIEHLINKNVKLTGIIEQKRDDFWTALSDHYVRIYLKSSEILAGKFIEAFPEKQFLNGIKVEKI